MLRFDSAALAVIDFQESLMPKIAGAEEILAKAVKLIRFAKELGIPILWTEQYPKGLGKTVESIMSELDGVSCLEKMAFGCMGDPGFVEALEKLGRKQLLITGVESHVCVMQTALGAVENGYEVFIPKDAAGSRKEAEKEAGLARMEQNGVQMVTTEMAIFEILHQAGTPEFKKCLPLIKDM